MEGFEVAVNVSSNFTADISNYIEKKLLPLARRQLVAYQFGEPIRLPYGRGTTYTATRYNRIPLPFQSLSEGVPPPSESLTLQQVSVVAAQWGDRIVLTDIAELTIEHPLFKTATDLMGLEIAELLERNTFNSLMSSTQVNYVNSRGARANLLSGDVMNITEVNRAVSMLHNIGAPRFMGDEQTNVKVDVRAGEPTAGSDPRGHPHYVSIIHPFVEMDMRSNSTIVTAWSYSDVNKLYNDELGEWGGVRFVRSNMVPSFSGVSPALTYTGVSTGGSLTTTGGPYYIILTGSDVQNQYESRIYVVSSSVAIPGASTTGSITFTTPSLTGYTWSAYIGTTTSPNNLATSPSGPTQGPLSGQAVQLPGSTLVTLTGVGASQTPPSPGPIGLTAYPCFVFGRGSYGIVTLDQVRTSFLTGPDKSDALNQLRVLGFKVMYGTIILNNTFMMRIEAVSSYNATFG